MSVPVSVSVSVGMEVHMTSLNMPLTMRATVINKVLVYHQFSKFNADDMNVIACQSHKIDLNHLSDELYVFIYIYIMIKNITDGGDSDMRLLKNVKLEISEAKLIN